MTFCLVILTYNEIDGVTALFDRLPLDAVDEAFAVDGGSFDGTVEFMAERGLPVIGQSRKGRGEAFRIALENSTSDVLILFSPDGNENPDDILRVRSQFEENSDLDMVIASRMMKGARNEEDGRIFRVRKWANNAFNLMANLAFNRHLFKSYITDSINGFRGIKRDALTRLDTDALGYTIEYQTTIRAFRQGMSILEIPTIEGERIGGESYAKSIPTGIAFLKCFWRELVR